MIGGVTKSFDKNGNVGRLGPMHIGKDGSRTDLINFSKDEKGNIVINAYERHKNIVSTNENGAQNLYSLGKDGYLEYRMNIVITEESLEKFVNADWTNFDSKKIDDIEKDYKLPRSMERSAEALPPEFKLDLQQVDVSFNIAVDKLQEVV